MLVPEGGSTLTPLNGIVKEVGLVLGLPDLAARTENIGSEGLGPWCAMSDPLRTGKPQHYSPWCKERLGWLKPTVIDPTVKQKLVLSPIEGSPKECFKVLVRPDGSEYLLLENRAEDRVRLRSAGRRAADLASRERPAEFWKSRTASRGRPGPTSHLRAVPYPSDGEQRVHAGHHPVEPIAPGRRAAGASHKHPPASRRQGELPDRVRIRMTHGPRGSCPRKSAAFITSLGRWLPERAGSLAVPGISFPRFARSAILVANQSHLSRSHLLMRTRYPRFALSLLLLAGGIALLAWAPSSDALAQRKGGKDFKGREKEKEAPPPNFTMPDDWTKAFTWRSIGPANMGGRITAISVYEADPTTYWVATASGGLLKTTNNGVTFEHQFDKEATVSIGDVCVAPSNKNIVWVGTGENNPRNSVSYGDGVYKSTDGGKNWKNMGLKKTFQIGRIVIHPKNPDIVYVGALGRLYGPNEERGLFKTTDGGKTWEKVLYIDDKTGVIDMRDAPDRPGHALVATWERRRDGFDSWPGGGLPDGYDGYDPVKKWGPGAGIYKTTDGGKTFKKLTKGLPTSKMGRIGLDIYRKDPNVVFAIIDCEKIGMGTPPKKAAAPATPYMGIHGEDAEGDGGARSLASSPTARPTKAGLEGRRRRHEDRRQGRSRPTTRCSTVAADREARRQGQARGQARREGRDGRVDLRRAPTARAAAAAGAAGSAARAAPPATRPYARQLRRPGRERPGHSRGRTATSTAASTGPPTAARPGRASTASTRGRCTSARSASIRPTTSTSTSSACRCTGRATAARRSGPAAAASTPTSTPCGSTRGTAGT